MTYYQILKVPKSANQTTIKKAYYDLVFINHPDRNNGPNAGEKTKKINEAYATLGDPLKRQEYDAVLSGESIVRPQKSTRASQQQRSPQAKVQENPKTEPTKSRWGYVIWIIIILFGIFSLFQKTEKPTPPSNIQNIYFPSPSLAPTVFKTKNVKTIQSPYASPSSIPKPSPASISKIDCVGPDGKHLTVTQKECDDFNNAWKNSKPNDSSSGELHIHCKYGGCTCDDGYQMNYSTNKCEQCPQNSHGSYGSCTCNDGYQKDFSTGQCTSCPEHSNGSYGSCTCENGYKKNYSSGQCEPCPPNSYGSYGSCICNDGYRQNYATGSCDLP